MNVKICENDENTLDVWKWLSYCKTQGAIFEGVLQIIDKTESTSSVKENHSIYSSPERAKALRFCEFKEIGDAKALEHRCKVLEDKGLFLKSAMYSIFSFNYSNAIRVIPEHCILAPILQNIQLGQSEKAMQKFFKKVAKYEKDLNLRNSLLFLSGTSEYSEILKSLSLLDSMGFALLFLNDSELKTCLKDLIERGSSEGSLQTLILSGFTQDSPQVLLKYYENTGDLQTVGILSIYAQLSLRSDILDMFVSSYKFQLNRMELFNARCLLEIEESKLLEKKKEKGKCIRCYYCGNSIALGDITGSPAIAKRGDPQSVSKLLLNHCPSCPASLPKCCVCLNNLKSINPYFTVDKGKVLETTDFFTWCEKCHHGGHSSHILEWFNTMSECPSYGCGCLCSSLDSS